MEKLNKKGRIEDMSSQLSGFNELILGQLSELGIELFNESGRGSAEAHVPKAIYEITKGVSNKKVKINSRKK